MHVRNTSRPHTCLGIQVNCTTNNLLMILRNFDIIKFHPLQPGIAYLYPLKIPENLKIFRFQGV